jgi:uncharacterized membrane protein
MKERFIYLVEKYFDKEITSDESNEFNRLLSENEELKKEFDEQKRIKEVLSKMNLKNPSKEVWDSYWISIYNRLERGLAWIVFSIGAIIIFAYTAVIAVEKFLEDTQTPIILKFGITFLVIGLVILIFSLLREKIFSQKRDKYKEIQR